MKTVRSLLFLLAVILIPVMTLSLHAAPVSFMDYTGPAMPAHETMANPNPPVRIMADPNINLNRVPPPRRFLLRAPSASTVQINFLPAGSPLAQWGDNTIAWPTDASNALIYAKGIWEALLTSTVPLTINAGWVNNLGAGILGHSGAMNFHRNFSGAPVADTWYPATLANSLAGSDLKPTDPDIYMGFSSTFSWYTGTDGSTPGTDYDLVSVVLHEICHGLGFAGSMTVVGGLGTWGSGTAYPFSYDRFTEDNAGTSLINTGTYPKNSVALANVLTSGNIFFDGTHANAANSGARVPLYAPGTWNGGSSYSHLAESFNGTPYALMTYSLGFGESEHSPGNVTMGLLEDVGWSTGGTVVTQTYTLTVQSLNPNSGVSITVTPNDNNGFGNGTTLFTRLYNETTGVTLTAPATSGANTFSHWNLNSVNQGGSLVLNVTMDASKTAQAVYSIPGATATLTVQSLNPNSGVNITVTPNDKNGLGNGTTLFTRLYDQPAAVVLTAPATAGANSFSHWELNALNQGANQILNVTMDADKIATAVYTSPPVSTNVYTVSKLKGKIYWKPGPFYSRGDLMIKGTIPVTVPDLTHLQNITFNEIMKVNNILGLPSGAYVGMNGKGTAIKYKSVDKVNKIKVITKLKLKDGILSVTWKGTKGFGMPFAFGIPDADTPGWVVAPANVSINASSGGNTILGLSSSGVNYSTKTGKKTSIK